MAKQKEALTWSTVSPELKDQLLEYARQHGLKKLRRVLLNNLGNKDVASQISNGIKLAFYHGDNVYFGKTNGQLAVEGSIDFTKDQAPKDVKANEPVAEEQPQEVVEEVQPASEQVDEPVIESAEEIAA